MVATSAVPLEQARQLIHEFHAACSQPALQEALEKLHSRGGVVLQLGLTQLMGKAASEAGKAALGKVWGLQQVLHTIEAHGMDSSIRARAQEIAALLRIDVGMLLCMPEARSPQVDLQRPLQQQPGETEEQRQQHLQLQLQRLWEQQPCEASAALPLTYLVELLDVHIKESGRADIQRRWSVLNSRSGRDRQMALAQLMGMAMRSSIQDCALSATWNVGKILATAAAHLADTESRTRDREAPPQFEPGKLPCMPKVDDIVDEDAATTTASTPSNAGEMVAMDTEVEEDNAGAALPCAEVEAFLDMFLQAIRKPEFERNHEQLRARGGLVLQVGLPQLLGKAAKRVVDAMALDGWWPLPRLVEAVREHLGSAPAVQAKAQAVEEQLQIGGLFLAAWARKLPTAKIDVRVARWANGSVGEEFIVRVPTEATIADVKAALSAAMCKEYIFSQSRLGKKHQAAIVAMRDEQKLGSLRELVLLGAESPAREVAAPQTMKEPYEMTVQQAIALQLDLVKEYRQEDFQAQLTRLFGTRPNKSPKAFHAELYTLFQSVQRDVFPRHGFAGTMTAATLIAKRMEESQFCRNEECSKLSQQIRELTSARAATDTESADSEDDSQDHVEVCVVSWSKGLCKQEVVVKVPVDATMWNVKVKLGKLTGSGDILQKGSLGIKPGAEMVIFKDNQRIGGWRRLLLLNAELPPAAAFPTPAARRRLKPERVELSADKELFKAPQPPALMLQQALALQRDLLDGFSAPDFQQALRELNRKKVFMSPKRFQMERTQLLLTVQSVILSKYGFSGDQRGVVDALRRFQEPHLASEADIVRIAAVLDRLLSEDAGGLGSAASPQESIAGRLSA